MLNVRQVRPRNGSLRAPMKKTLGNAPLSLSRYLSINTKTKPFSGLQFWRPKTITETTALSLSGGGSKGSFQVGTLHFFHKSGLWKKFRVTRIASSSVGSVNALKLAEDQKNSIPDMVKVWMNLKFPSHMYNKTKALKDIEKQVDGGLSSILSNEFFTIFDSWADVDGIRDDIGQLVRGGSLYDLKPTRNSLSMNVDFKQVKNSKIDLRMIASEQRTQRPVAFTKKGTLIRPCAKTSPIPHIDWSTYETVALKSLGGKTSFKDRMLNAVEASAAIPGVFPLVTAIESKAGKDWKGFYVDGGVNDILPRRYAGRLNGVTSDLSKEPVHFLSIFAGTVDEDNEVTPIEEQRLYRQKYNLRKKPQERIILTGGPGNSNRDDPLNFPFLRPSWRWKNDEMKPNLVENVTRGLLTVLSEVARGDISEGQKGAAKNIIIQPYQAVHDTIEVHPGKLRINAAYGYMSAFDQLLIAGGTLSKKEENLLLRTSYEITRKRVLTVKRQEISIYKIVYAFLRNEKFGSQKYVDKFLSEIDESPRRSLKDTTKLMLSFSKKVNNADATQAFFDTQLFAKILTTNMIFEADTLKRIRQDKKAIAELVVSRVQHFGLGSVPVNLDQTEDSQRKQHNTVASWWTDFELSNRNSVFLARPLSKRQQVGSIIKKAFEKSTLEKDASFSLVPDNLPREIVRALS